MILMSASSRTPASVHASPHDSPPPKHPPPSPETHPPQRPRTNISRASHGVRRCCASSHMYMRRKTRLRTLPRPHPSYRPASTPFPHDASAIPRFGSCRNACTRLRFASRVGRCLFVNFAPSRSPASVVPFVRLMPAPTSPWQTSRRPPTLTESGLSKWVRDRPPDPHVIRGRQTYALCRSRMW